MFKESDKEMQVDDIDQAFLRAITRERAHTFRNKAINNFFNELRNVLEDIENRKSIYNHVDADGWFRVETRVKKEN